MLARVEKETAFELDRLTVAFDAGGTRFEPIRDLDLKIGAGEITCILGRSGCGKTTLLRALGGFVPTADTGGVLFNGRFLEAPTPEIVMIFQENNLYPWLTVAGNVGFGLRFKGVKRQRRRELTQRMLADVGLGDATERYPYQLSGGMRQRAAIARAFITDPSVLLLDEPFSALDVSLRRRMHGLLHDLWDKTGKTMVMVTHNIEEAILVGHRLIVLGDAPARVLVDRDVRDEAMKDRYGQPFLDLQREIEGVIYDEEDGEA